MTACSYCTEVFPRSVLDGQELCPECRKDRLEQFAGCFGPFRWGKRRDCIETVPGWGWGHQNIYRFYGVEVGRTFIGFRVREHGTFLYKPNIWRAFRDD